MCWQQLAWPSAHALLFVSVVMHKSFVHSRCHFIATYITTYAAAGSEDGATDCVLGASGMSAEDAMRAYIE